MEYNIDDISALLSGVQAVSDHEDGDGWFFSKDLTTDYVPARLALNGNLTGDINGARVILISAPGAVGKSVLARELSNKTGSIYLDLSKASSIAGNYVIGGLANKDILPAWNSGAVGLIIDSLDEARLRVTQDSFEDFLLDVSNVSKKNKNPIIIFGRVGIIEEAWLILSENHDINCPVFDIDFFNESEATYFIEKNLVRLSESQRQEYRHLSSSISVHSQVYKSSIRGVVDELKEISGAESTRFFGYAPVLEAVSKVIGTIKNPSRIFEEMRDILSGEMLLSICKAVLSREQSKLTQQLPEKFDSIKEGLYSIDEQLNRLACRLFDIPTTDSMSMLSGDLIALYNDAVESMLPQHPFLDGTGRKVASSVFEACILSHALMSENESISNAAKNYCLRGVSTPNPFLFDFFVESRGEHGNSKVNSAYIGILFDSALSKLKINESATLIVNDDEDMSLHVEFIISNSNDEDLKEIEFTSDGYSSIALGTKVGNVFINTESSDVDFASSEQLELFSPISISCDCLRINSEKIIVKSVKKDEGNTSVILEANRFESNQTISPPLVRSGAELYVNWPSSESFPWSAFSSKIVNANSDDRVADALRVFRRIVMAFRSHSKGRLARLQDKVNHARMLRGEDGRMLLSQLVEDGVISPENHMYYLEPNLLGSVAGASFLQVNTKNYSDETLRYVARAIKHTA
ncbi:TPA: hypothetical protein ME921_005605 [Klebsiella pneumoniae]|nr:hypothetical protein [Klebsiella pneumoniae]HBW5813235.1 hypothetical protein [Klebsiella pneumoniae]